VRWDEDVMSVEGIELFESVEELKREGSARGGDSGMIK